MKNAFFLLFAAFLFSVVPLSAQIISKGTHTVGSSLSLPAFSQSGLLMPNQAGFTTTKFDDESISPGLDEYFFDQYFIIVAILISLLMTLVLELILLLLI